MSLNWVGEEGDLVDTQALILLQLAKFSGLAGNISAKGICHLCAHDYNISKVACFPVTAGLPVA